MLCVKYSSKPQAASSLAFQQPALRLKGVSVSQLTKHDFNRKVAVGAGHTLQHNFNPFQLAPACPDRLASSAAASTSRRPQLQQRTEIHESFKSMICQAGRKPQRQTVSQEQEQEQEEEEEEEDDGFLDYDEGEEDADGFFGGGEDDGEDFLELEVDEGTPGVNTGGEVWANTALEAARTVLSSPSMQDLDLYLFRLLPGRKLDIRLDRLTDTYGSPSIDDIEKFSRMLYQQLIASMGEEEASEISLEVSSPGAERTLALPQDLDRFGSLPLRVEYINALGAQMNQALQLESYDKASGLTVWKLADVKANAPGKGRGMSKKQREARFEISLSSVSRIRVFVDF